MKLPSKELLSEVLGIDVNEVKGIEANTPICGCVHSDGWYDEINIYEFSYLCKEWAIKIDYKIESHTHLINKRIIGVASFNMQDNTTKFFQADAEPEAIFKACEWLLEKTKCGS